MNASAADPRESLDPAPSTVGALMSRLAQSGGVRARFLEIRRLSILMEPIETRGRLQFSPPDRMVRVTDAPGATRMSIHGRQVAWTSDEGSGSLILRKHDVAADLTSDLMVLLRGDLAELERRHHVMYETHADAWHLALVPRDARVAAVVDHIRASGHGDRVEQLEVFERNEDTTTTRFYDVETGLSWSDAELKAEFDVDTNGSHR